SSASRRTRRSRSSSRSCSSRAAPVVRAQRCDRPPHRPPARPSPRPSPRPERTRRASPSPQAPRARAMPDRPEAPAARALAWLYSPRALREPLATLFALEREIGESLRPGLDHQLAHARLAWWREECERTAQARPSHPLTRELEGYCERWSAAMIEPAVQLAAPAAAAEPARALGRSLCEIELLLSLASDARLGRLRLSLDELECAPATAEELARPPWPAALA